LLEALAQGVPQVAIPITVDQPGVAARIAEKKTGLVVSLKELTPSRLSLLLDQVLNDSTYRDKARYFQKVIAETNGLSKAANLLEQAFGFGNPRETAELALACDARARKLPGIQSQCGIGYGTTPDPGALGGHAKTNQG
jgi:zeaxanthin glucosyltransferase